MWNAFWFLIGGILGLIVGGLLGNVKRSDLYSEIYWREQELRMWRKKWENLKSEKEQKPKEK